MIRALAVLLLLATTLPLGACAITRQREQVLDLPPDARLLAVDVENFRGDVVVKRDAELTGRAWVQGFVSVSISEGREERAALQDAVEIESAIEEAADGVATLRVRSDTTQPDNDQHHVRLEIVTPRLDGVRIVNSGGVVEVIDPTGNIDIRNEGGGVLVRTGRPITGDVLILNEDGDVYVQAPQGSAGDVYLQSLEGKVAIADQFDEVRGETIAQRDEITANLNFGGNAIDLRTSVGDVRLMIMPEPLAFTRAVKSHPPDPRDHMGRDGYRRYLRNLPDDQVKPIDRGGYGWDLWEHKQLQETRGKRSNVDR